MTNYPRLSTELNGDAWYELDMDAVTNILRGFTPEGTFRSPYTYLIDFDGTDYSVSNAYQTIYGGPDDINAVDGAVPQDVLQAALDVGGKIYVSCDLPDVAEATFSLDTELVGVNGATITAPSTASTVPMLYNASHDIDIAISGLVLDGNRSAGADAWGIQSNGGALTVSDCIIKNCLRDGIVASGTDQTWRHFIAKNNYITNVGNDTTHLGPGIRVSMQIEPAGTENIPYVLIDGNHITDSYEHGVKIYATAADNAVIVNNKIRGMYSSGITCEVASTIANNHIIDCCSGQNHGITVVNHAQVLNNNINGFGGNGIWVGGGYNTITGNRVLNSTAGYAGSTLNGIYIRYDAGYGKNSLYNTVSGNLISTVGGVGIYLLTSTYNTITGNVVVNSTSYGIRCTDSSSNHITGNSLTSSTYGFYESGTSDYNMVSSCKMNHAANIAGANTTVMNSWVNGSWTTGITQNIGVAKVGGGTRTLEFVNGVYTGFTDS